MACLSHTTPMRAIRTKCLECCAGSAREVQACRLDDCALWQYRSGRNPRRAGIGGNPRLSSTLPTSQPKDDVDDQPFGRTQLKLGFEPVPASTAP